VGVWGVVLVVCVCVGVGGVVLSVCVCVCDLLIFLHMLTSRVTRLAVLNKLNHRSTNTGLGSTTSAPRGGDITDKKTRGASRQTPGQQDWQFCNVAS